MPVPKELTDKIADYEKQGFIASDIISGLRKSETYPDIAIKVDDYLKQGYTPSDILNGIKKAEIKTVKEPVGSPSRIKQIYDTEVSESVDTIKEAYNKPTVASVAKGALGGIRFISSPLTALAKGAIGEPVENLTRSVIGDKVIPLPKTKIGDVVITDDINIPELVGALGENAAYFAPYGKLVKTAMDTGKIPQSTKEAIIKEASRKEVSKLSAKKPLEFPSEPSPELAASMKAEGKLAKPIIQEGLQKEVTDAATIALKDTFKTDKRIGQQIVDLIHSNQFDWDALPSILDKYKITPQEFALQLKDTYSASGRTLGRLSWTVKQLKKTFNENPEATSFLEKVAKELPEQTMMDKFFNGWYSAEKYRRGLMVTQLATSVRNVVSQAGKTVLGSMDDALQGAIKGTIGGEGNTLKQMGDGLDNVTAFLHRLSPSARKNLDNIINSEAMELTRMKLFSAPVQEVTIGSKAVNFLNTLNRTQEYFFRKIGFEAKLTQLLRHKGIDIEKIDPKLIPQDMYEKATQYTLEMTFASLPKSKFARKFVQQWADNPIMTSLFNPYPRFAFGNALPMITNFSPLGFLKALNPNVIAKLANGNPDQFARFASEATLGTLMLGSAMAIRNSEHGGENWYEIKKGDKYIDTRAYAPFSSYLFFAEALTHPEKLKATDFLQATIGLNRIAGTGLVLTDVVRSKKVETGADTLKKLLGQYIGGFSVPLRTPKDFYAGVNKEEAKIRDTIESPVIAPTMANIPVLSQKLPEAKSPLKTGSLETEQPVLRQFTGLSVKTKTLIQKEVDKLAMDKSRIYPKTGIPNADRLISEQMSPIIEKLTPVVLNNQEYKKASPAVKRLILSNLFQSARKTATGIVIAKDPSLGLMIKYEGMSGDVKELLKEAGE